MNSTFYDQLGGVTGVFEQWGACEKTVVMCALVRRIPWSGLKMLQRSVEEALTREGLPPADSELLEREANDESVLTNLLAVQSDSEDSDEGWSSLQRLVSLVPLVRGPGALVLVRAVPALVQRCVASTSCSHTILARQLLTYLLVHPALSTHHHHQRTLTQWLRYLENHISGIPNPDNLWTQRTESSICPSTNIWGSNGSFRRTIGKNIEFRTTLETTEQYNSDLQESFSKNGRDVDISVEEDRLNFDVTIAQPKSQRSNSLTPPTTNFMQMSSSAENLSEEPLLQKPRSFSLSSEHSLGYMRPMMYGTTGSETRLDDLRTNSCMEPGMSMVAPWLKSLRLHKYVWLFSNITYDQMMAMDEEYLEKLGVTKGARHKLLLSISKLSERETLLSNMMQGGVGPGRVLRALRGALVAPLPRESSLPTLIVRLLEMASKALLPGGSGQSCSEGDDEPDLEVDPLSLHCWLVEKALHHELFASTELNEPLKRMRYRLPPRQFYHRLSDMPPAPAPHARKLKPRYKPGAARMPGPPVHTKSHSYPQPAHDIHSSLDALCLQMTEQAIN